MLTLENKNSEAAVVLENSEYPELLLEFLEAECKILHLKHTLELESPPRIRFIWFLSLSPAEYLFESRHDTR